METQLWSVAGWSELGNTFAAPGSLLVQPRITVVLTPGERLLENRGPTGASTVVNERALRMEVWHTLP